MGKSRVKVIGIISSLMIAGLTVACSTEPASTPTQKQVPEPTTTTTTTTTPTPSNSESASKIEELEAKIKQLEAENQQLNIDLPKANAVLKDIYTLVTSSSYANALSKLTNVQNKSSDLAYFAEGLPDVPPLPPGLTASQINNAIDNARYLRQILRDLPSFPPPGWPPYLPFPQELLELDNMKQTFISMTEWMEDLRDLPEFMATPESLNDLRSRIETYLVDVQNTISDAESQMQQVRDTATGY